MPKQKKPKHIFLKYPPEIFYRILSQLNIQDLAVMSQVSEWVRNIVNSLRFDYQVLSITKDEQVSTHFQKKFFVLTPQTCTYAELQIKLNLQSPNKKAWQKAIEEVKRQYDDPCEVTMQAMKALITIGFGACLPMMGGSLLDKAGIDVRGVAFGFSGFDVGFGITMSCLSYFCYWMLKTVYDNNDRVNWRSVQLIEEDGISVKLPMC